jgi:hypothetical protein
MQEFEIKFVLEMLLRLGLVEVSINNSGKMQYFLTEEGLQKTDLIQNLLGPVAMV